MASKPSQAPRITVDGMPLSDLDMVRLVDAIVDDDMNMADMFELRFNDPQRDFASTMPFKIGSRVVIKAGRLGDDPATVLIDAEVTSVETSVGPAGAFLTVIGYDHSHRLHRGKKSATYNDVTDSDLVKKLAQAAGVSLGTVDSTDMTHPQISQWLESDWDFLRRRANEIGYALYVKGGQLHFIKVSSLAPAVSVEACYGKDLVEFNARLSAQAYCDRYQVVGWDVDKAEPIVLDGVTTPYAAVLENSPFSPDTVAQPFGSSTFVSASRALGTEAEARQALAGVGQHACSVPLIGDGVMIGNPQVSATDAVVVKGTGRAFDGLWLITHSRHVFDDRGYTTYFTGSGTDDASLGALLSTTDRGAQGPTHFGGVTVGLVSDNADPENTGRVKLILPYFDRITTGWARVVYPGAGHQRGFDLCPEVGDEVLVAFEQGDIRHAFVLGGLHNGQNEFRLDGYVSNDGTTIRRAWTSRNGHRIEFVEDPSAAHDDRIEITTKNDTKVIIGDDGTVRIETKNVEVKASDSITMKATGNVTIEGRSVTVNAQQSLEMSGSSGASLTSNGQTEIKGAVVSLN